MRLIKHPVLCNYYLTYRCNASCSFCDIWERPSPYASMDHVSANLADLKKLGVKVIDFTGGEPLLHPQIDVILKMAKEQGFITTLTTNGLLYPKKAASIRGLVDMLHFSLDYAEAKMHDEARGVPCFDFVMRSIEIARDLGERPDILMTVFEENRDQIERIYQEICLPNALVLILNPAFSYHEVDTSLSSEALDEMEHWGKKPSVYLNRAFVALRRAGGNHIDRPVCKAGSSTVVISPDYSLVLPCYHLGLREMPIENRLYALYREEESQLLIAQEGRLPACEGCTINCYMQPSFAVNMNSYFWKALPSTIKYNRMKGTWKQLFR